MANSIAVLPSYSTVASEGRNRTRKELGNYSGRNIAEHSKSYKRNGSAQSALQYENKDG